MKMNKKKTRKIHKEKQAFRKTNMPNGKKGKLERQNKQKRTVR